MQRNHVVDRISYRKPDLDFNARYNSGRQKNRNGYHGVHNKIAPDQLLAELPTLSDSDADTANLPATSRVPTRLRNALLAAAVVPILYSSIACSSGQTAPPSTTTPAAVVETYTPPAPTQT
jgi:hypothetical protein